MYLNHKVGYGAYHYEQQPADYTLVHTLFLSFFLSAQQFEELFSFFLFRERLGVRAATRSAPAYIILLSFGALGHQEALKIQSLLARPPSLKKKWETES